MTERIKKNLLLPFCLILLLLTVLFSEAVKGAISASLLFCFNALIPSLFPAMILSRVILSYTPAPILPGAGLFSKLFKLPRVGFFAFLMGSLCGFPVGAKIVNELFLSGELSDEEARRLLAFSNNTGPAFPVSAVGIGLYGSAGLGILLYLTQIFSALLFGLLSARGKPHPTEKHVTEQKRKGASLPDIIGDATLSMLTLTGTVVAFSSFSVFLTFLFPKPLIPMLYAFLEIGNAVFSASAFPARIGLPLTAFALSFSGLSVHLQSAAMLKGTSLSPPVTEKLIQGCFSFALTLLWSIKGW